MIKAKGEEAKGYETGDQYQQDQRGSDRTGRERGGRYRLHGISCQERDEGRFRRAGRRTGIPGIRAVKADGGSPGDSWDCTGRRKRVWPWSGRRCYEVSGRKRDWL